MQDLELSEEQIMIRDMARDFARGEIAPTPRPGKRPAGSMMAWCAKWANWACWAWWCPRNFGGSYTDYVAYALAVEEISAG
jgi:alkylation response protein AidB-like acyl-CoA dehydrogenase